MIPYENLQQLNKPFEKALAEKFQNIIGKGWFILGSEVEAFEKEFANYVGAKYCVGLASGLDALTISLCALELPKGSEVIVPSNTYIATILSIVQAGLRPILAEPYISTYNINPKNILNSISPRTSAIMAVHLYGKSCDMKSIMKIANDYNLKVVEDCAQSHGSSQFGKKTGTFGDFGAFSFYPTKNLGALGDAGAIVTDSEELAIKVKMLRNYGSKVKYYNEYIGFNSRLDEMQAGFLRIKLQHLDTFNNHKRHLASIYNERLSNRLIKPVLDDNFFDVFHIYNIRHPRRDELKEYLLKNNVSTEIHYPVSPNRQIAMQGIIDSISTPISEEIHNTTISLPISFCHTASDIEKISELINKWIQ